LLWSHILPLWNKISKKIPKQKVSKEIFLASPSKHNSKRNVKLKGESRMNHDPYVWYQWRYHMCE
jgi:hypothetical protein